MRQVKLSYLLVVALLVGGGWYAIHRSPWANATGLTNLSPFFPLDTIQSSPPALLPDARVGGLVGAVVLAADKLLVGEGAQVVMYEQPALQRVSEVYLPGVVQDIAYAAGRGYVVTGASGLQIIEVAEAARLIGSVPLTGNPRGVAVVGDWVYVAAESAGLHSINVADPTQPQAAGTVRGRGRINAVAVRPPYAYLADQGATLSVADVTNPAAPSLVATLNNSSTVLDLAVEGERLYLATTRGLQVYSLADPAAPVELGRYPATGFYSAYSLALADGRVWVGHYQTGIDVFTVDAMGQPTSVCPACPSPYIDASRANVVALAAGNGRVYVADGDVLRVMGYSPSPPNPHSHIGRGGEEMEPRPPPLASPGRGAEQSEGLRLIETVPGFTLPTAVALADGHAYIAAASQGQAVVALHPRPRTTTYVNVGDFSDPPDARAVAITRHDVFLASGAAVYRFDRADPTVRRDRYPLAQVKSLASDGGRLFATNGQVVQALRLDNSAIISTTVGLTETRRLVWQSEVLYLAGDGGLRVMRWPSGGPPVMVGAYDGPAATSLAVWEAWTALGHSGGVDLLMGYALGEGRRLARLATPSPVVDVAFLDASLVVLEASGQVTWWHLADPTQPVRLDTVQALAAPTALAVGDGYVAVTDLTGGLWTWRPVRSRLWFPWIQRR